MLRLFFLGEFQITCDGLTIDGINTARLQALLAFLVLYGNKEISRQRIAFLFWPESAEGQARTNLRQLLHHLRQAFPDIGHYLHIGTKTLKWQEGAQLQIDVVEFAECLSGAQAAAAAGNISAEQSALQRAYNLYQADLLPTCYDEWIEADRSRLRQQFTTALTRLIELLEQQGQYAEAITKAERLLSLDEFSESTYCTLIRLHALNNDRISALHTYDRCVDMLRDELAIQPSAETRQLFERLTQAETERPAMHITKSEIPLIGREKERSELVQVWQKVASGNTHFMLVCGEAGIGKTRLAEELIAYVQSQGMLCASAICYSAEGRLAYGPVTEWLKNDTIYPSLSELENIWQLEISRLVPEILSGSVEIPELPPLTESWQRQRLFESLTRAIHTVPNPLLLFIDDIQWCDPETLEWLHYLLRSNYAKKILIMATLRSGSMSDNGPLLSLILELRRSSYFTEIELAAIDAAQTAQLARHVSNKEIDEKQAAELFARTEGNPMYVVEMTRAGMEEWKTGDTPLSPHHEPVPVPQSVKAVIQTRLANISSAAQKILELAAVIGRVFTFDVLNEACEENEDVLIHSLDELWERRLIREQGRMAYDFSHDIIRKVVAAGISRARFCLLNRRVSEALEKRFAGQFERISGQLAIHWERAGYPLRAIFYYEQACKTAQRIFANEEAAEYLERGLRLVLENLDGRERDEQELNLLNILSPCLVQSRGYGASEVQKNSTRLWDLSRQLNQPPTSPLLRMLAISKLVVGEISEAENFGLRLLEQSQRMNDAVAEVEAHYVLGVTYHWQGRFIPAHKHLEKAIAGYEAKNHTVHITDYAQDPSVICRIRLAVVLWHLGYLEQSQTFGTEALELAEKLQHPFSRSYALHWFAWLQNLRNDAGATLKHAELSISFSEEYPFPYFASQSRILKGWALFMKGETEDGIQEMRYGLSCFRAIGSEVGCSYFRALIASALATNGSYVQSIPLIDEAIKAIKNTDEHWSDAAIFEMKGTVLLHGNSDVLTGAEHWFRNALAVARQQQSKTDALRIALQLKKFLLKAGRQKEAIDMFQDVQCWAINDLNSNQGNALNTLVDSWAERF